MKVFAIVIFVVILVIALLGAFIFVRRRRRGRGTKTEIKGKTKKMIEVKDAIDDEDADDEPRRPSRVEELEDLPRARTRPHLSGERHGIGSNVEEDNRRGGPDEEIVGEDGRVITKQQEEPMRVGTSLKPEQIYRMVHGAMPNCDFTTFEDLVNKKAGHTVYLAVRQIYNDKEKSQITVQDYKDELDGII